MMHSLDDGVSFPDLSRASGLVVRARQSAERGISNFALALVTGETVFTAKLRLTGEFADYVLPWDNFTCTSTGHQISGSCPAAIHGQLSAVRAVSLSTASFGIE